MRICGNCNGAILEPNTTYGYAGAICYCPKDPSKMYQNPLPVTGGTYGFGDQTVLSLLREIKDLLLEIKNGKN